MELKENQFALAASATVGSTYLLCVAFIRLLPDVALLMFDLVTHFININNTVFGNKSAFSIFTVFLGLIIVLVYTFVAAWIFAWLYNRFAK